jgi:hypothetical protein
MDREIEGIPEREIVGRVAWTDEGAGLAQLIARTLRCEA